MNAIIFNRDIQPEDVKKHVIGRILRNPSDDVKLLDAENVTYAVIQWWNTHQTAKDCGVEVSTTMSAILYNNGLSPVYTDIIENGKTFIEYSA